MPARETEEATMLMRELTTRDRQSARSTTTRGARVRLFTPLRRLRRTLFGSHG
ncbi:hypothetical protein SAMN05444716_102162 [Streptomyces harbinensis]|uniref:Uncharacterized protein n=1 Tax=Streptomyces harbinensis TaxID=1176198 RepID=A0A1I6QPG3_9ACTN|nr:hypothetical protein SAMN05444716_102162 [Streptomyces harbinensis]